MKLLATAGLAQGTRKTYKSAIQPWLEFCDLQALDPLDLDNSNAADFIAWSYERGDNSNRPSKALTAASSLLTDNGLSWKRSKYISRILNGFTIKRPPKPRRKRPFCGIHLTLTWQHHINLKNFNHLAVGAGLLLGYHGRLRPSEFSRRKGTNVLRWRQIEFIPSFQRAREAQITLHKSKTNQTGLKHELILLSCKCKEKVLGVWVPCPIHHLQLYIKVRTKLFHKPKANEPLLINFKGKPLSYNMVHNFMGNAVTSISRKQRVRLDPKHYTPHTLRIGGCTDLARTGSSNLMIRRYGRWESDVWKEIYVCLDLVDVSKLLDVTISSLLGQILSPLSRSSK